jgi:site-specific DNA-methyltransferase (adenine-specific)
MNIFNGADLIKDPTVLETAISPTLICGDCIRVLAAFPKECVDVVITSPPYNLKLNYATYQDNLSETDYLDWLVSVAEAVKRVMRPGASFFLNITGSPKQPWLPFELITRLRKLFELQNHIVWVKSITTSQGSVGHFKPVNGHRFLHHAQEHIFHLTLANNVSLNRLAIGVPYADKSNIARRGHTQDLRCRGNTWFIPYETVQSKTGKFNHPGTFPLNLPRWCIKLHGQPDSVVLDPFMGTGTTMIASLQEGMQAIGIDLDPAYVEITRQRILQI